ncbi:hypothetical protein PV367_13620 [Streptomyces europaeiscabiei]|uniref:Uncharacterized protein n=1 Tax=Streptomyces europaeiscabiei TaxID=146819 RepID=A0AAJ2PNH0_9ACTN|nr:hypothetical protein [Streptomyces europaeiscabiei]MDX3130805.1 hypothetical protein [Streptomyces europaeiscabiei]
MLVESLTALALSCGTAVVQAAGTDAWNGLRTRVGDLFAHGEAARTDAELARLDHTAEVLSSANGRDSKRLREEGMWQGRFEALLESLDTPGQNRAAEQLREMLSFVAASTGDTAMRTGKATASEGGSAVTGIKRGRGSQTGPAAAVETGDADAPGSRLQRRQRHRQRMTAPPPPL